MTADFTTRITEILRDNIPIRRSDCKLGVSDLVLKVTAHELAAAAEEHYRPRVGTVEVFPPGTKVRYTPDGGIDELWSPGAGE